MGGVGVVVPGDVEQFIKVPSPTRFHPRLPIPWRPRDDHPGTMALQLGPTPLGAPGPFQGV